jgi:hypothetical protein
MSHLLRLFSIIPVCVSSTNEKSKMHEVIKGGDAKFSTYDKHPNNNSQGVVVFSKRTRKSCLPQFMLEKFVGKR